MGMTGCVSSPQSRKEKENLPCKPGRMLLAPLTWFALCQLLALGLPHPHGAPSTSCWFPLSAAGFGIDPLTWSAFSLLRTPSAYSLPLYAGYWLWHCPTHLGRPPPAVGFGIEGTLIPRFGA
eukprot:1147581-Pelagomonas_calceolata.AAC.4